MFAPQKVPFLKISDDVIACDLWSPPNQKSWLRLWLFAWLFSFFNQSKNNGVLKPRTGHFRGLVGFKAKV